MIKQTQKKRVNRRNQKGSILLIVAMLSIIFALAASFALLRFENELAKVKNVKSVSEKGNLLEEIEAVISLPKSCLSTFGGRNPNNTARGVVTRIINVRGSIDSGANGEASMAKLSDQIIFESNTNPALAPVYGGDLTQISSFSLETDVNIGPSSSGEAKVIVDILSNPGGFSRNKQGVIFILVSTDSARRIIKCEPINKYSWY